MNAMPPRRIGIIGGGVAGIVTARTLLNRGFDCTVFERGGRLGGVWTEGYANFGIQVQRELYEFPDWPFPPGTPDFTPGPIVRDYIEGYARHFGVLPRPEFYRAVRGGEIAPLLSEISTFTPTGVVLRDGRSRDLDTVVLATGWESDHGFIAEDIRAALDFQSDGLYLYRQILPLAVASLAFIGHASTISSVPTYSLQARWLADIMTGRCPRPRAAEMASNVAAQQAWKRRTMPFSRGRGARPLLYMLHYHDEQLEDLGVSPLRKTGVFAPFKEVFAPYQPSDYREVVGPAKD